MPEFLPDAAAEVEEGGGGIGEEAGENEGVGGGAGEGDV